jgi:hypothetical protein
LERAAPAGRREKGTQLAAAPVEPRGDRSDRGSHNVGDLFHAIAFDVCEVDRGAEVARELLERTLEEEGVGQLVQDFGIG